MRTLSTVTIAALLSLPVPAAADTLYQRLGGYDAIAAVTDAFMARLAADPEFERFFAGHSEISHRSQRQHVVNYVCEATGGPCFYTGRDLKTAHVGLGITEELWGQFAGHFEAVLDEFGVSDPLKAEVFAIFGGVQSDIVARR